MFELFQEHLSNWCTNPRRARPGYIVSRLWRLSSVRLRAACGLPIPPEPLHPPIDADYVEILHDPVFQRSVRQVQDLSCLDVARLANLWNAVKLAGPGVFLEIGSYRGGTALHICNAMDASSHGGAPFFCFDPFEKGGYEKVSSRDTEFKVTDFMDTDFASVARLLSVEPNATVVQGYFPAAAESLSLRDIAYCHLDINLYEPTLRSLEYLAPRLAPRSVIMLDDLGRCETEGVREAVNRFLEQNPSFLLIELFPCQGMLLPRLLW